MASEQKNQALGAQFVEWAQAGEAARIEETWIENVQALPTQAAFYKEWIKAMRKSGAGDKAEELLVLALENRVEARKFKVALRILLAALPFYPKSDALRQPMLAILRGFYADQEMLEPLIKLTGLSASGGLIEGFQALQDWLKLTPGQVYQHYDWGEGVVQELDLIAGKVKLTFGETEKLMTVDGVKKYLKFIEPGHFLALRTRDPETLMKQADVAPAELIKLALASQPDKRLKQGELKALLTPSLIAAEQWNAWWGKAREALKLDPFVDFDASGGAHGVILLREQPRTFQQEVEERFFAADAGPELKAELIRQLAKRAKELTLPDALGRKMADLLHADWLNSEGRSAAIRLEYVYMLQDLSAALSAVGIKTLSDAELLASIDNYAALCEMDNEEYGVRALVKLLERDGDAGCRQAAELLPKAPVKLAQAIWDALDEEHHQDMAVAALQKLFNQPLENPDTYVWAVRATIDGSWKHVEDYFPASSVVPDLLGELDEWQQIASEEGRNSERAAAARTLLSRIRTLLAADKFEAISKSVATMSREGVARLKHQIQVHSALPSTFKSQAERAINITRRDLDETQAAKARDEDLHLCTAKAYEEKVAELRHITSVRIPTNAKVIEAARMEGDLRENAGYQYAKEEQKMLMQTKASLSELLSRARIVTAREVDPTKINFGAAIRVQNEKSGKAEDYTILGRWEANPERHVLSFQAPLAQQLLGLGVGDTVVIEHPGGGSTPYKVLEIRNALEGAEWSAEAAKAPEGA